MILVMIWCTALTAAVPPLMGWARFDYSEQSFNCGIAVSKILVQIKLPYYVIPDNDSSFIYKYCQLFDFELFVGTLMFNNVGER